MCFLWCPWSMQVLVLCGRTAASAIPSSEHTADLSVCLPTYLSFYLSICLTIYLSVYGSIYLSIYLSICLSIHPSIYLISHPSIHPFIHPSICIQRCKDMYSLEYMLESFVEYLSFMSIRGCDWSLGPWSPCSATACLAVGSRVRDAAGP